MRPAQREGVGRDECCAFREGGQFQHAGTPLRRERDAAATVLAIGLLRSAVSGSKLRCCQDRVRGQEDQPAALGSGAAGAID